MHATMSLDMRYMVTNRWTAELTITDLIDRQYVVHSLDARMSGGVAINRGVENHGLLAVHAGTNVIIYRFADMAPPEELSRYPINGSNASDLSAPVLSIAWSTDGRHVIAGASRGDSEFIVLEVAGNGTEIREVRTLTACRASDGLGRGVAVPVDVWTPNRLLEVPTPTANEPVPTATTTSTPTATASATASATATAVPPSLTPIPEPIYLPLALREECIADEKFADTVLVLDASTSMLEPVWTGYTKRDAALDAAAQFVALLKAGDQAAIAWFNGAAAVEQVLTSDRTALTEAMARIQNDQSTRLDLGIEVAAQELRSDRRRPGNRPVIILLTDGKANPEPVETAVEKARRAKEAGATIFVIGLGHAEDLDDEALRLIASRPGYYYQTPRAEDLAAVYEEIAGVVPCPPEQVWGGRSTRTGRRSWTRPIGRDWLVVVGSAVYQP